ncbi:GNAT family N-acetyltransferase [Paenibacillus radicis (ex Xue et al. 2023)]|uniref:GNAT family N-acetyltransferase n=1 Tax=Paenibacillus radicis (ex Xue et al. 2023) TaxID=2972489 RepID=A0ABT1YEM2_9BACL|nr:GNAT family N-acetyltransferase [Paenibacillus radicis (ex Xue et al. 2023)]MCR8631205.1 GNAT family N-acetyltransferase [Paenibacillus radicis (ex Xue et al. 2023)]
MLSFVAVVPEDESFLFELYASTRYEELTGWGWDASEKESFLQMQFEFQRRMFHTQHPDAVISIVCADRCRVGRVVVADRADAIYVIDLSLFPQYQNQSIGTTYLLMLQSEARACGKPIRLNVQAANRALRLYLRLGFRIIEEQGVYHTMEWSP